ncbi:MAG: Xaa-Pro peptidase family protein [Desulfomonilaceae bacterium]|nr:Xaa-Pro peptidase family protein [Desulfomonilaceae bacterium]
MPSTPIDEVHHRIKALQHAMQRHGFDAALIVQQTDLYYFSGTAQDAHLYVPAEGEPRLLVRRDFQRASEESPLEDVMHIKSFEDVKNAVLTDGAGSLKCLGMELDVLPVNNYHVYVGLFPGTEIKDVSLLIKLVRMIKSPYEIDLIRRAAAMNDELFRLVKDILREGMSEMEFSGLLEAEYRRMGHQGYVRVRSFNQHVFYGHVMSGRNLAVPSCSVGPTGGPGANASMPHGAGSKIIQRHEPVQIDYVGVVKGYVVDQARTYYLGEPPEEFRRIHEVAVRIQQALVEQGMPGTRAEAMYDTALRMAEEAGWSEFFLGHPMPVPFVGHGVGLELDEFPIVGKKSPHVLQEGMVIALEPKFIIPDRGLAGIENSYAVTSTGMERLTPFDDAIQVLP